MVTQTFSVKLEHVIPLTTRIRHFAFKCVDGHDFQYIPGQFISIHFDVDGKLIRRSYSIASIPGKSNLIEFAMAYVQGGPASERLFTIQAQATLEFSGPYGRLILRDEPIRRCFLVATGTGVTPYRSMLPQIMEKLNADPQLEVWIVLGVQYCSDQLYAADFLRYAAYNPRLHFCVYHSRDDLKNPQFYEFKGYVQTAFDTLKPDPSCDIVYLCGNPNMIDDSYKLLQELGFSAQQVRREKYVS